MLSIIFKADCTVNNHQGTRNVERGTGDGNEECGTRNWGWERGTGDDALLDPIFESDRTVNNRRGTRERDARNWGLRA